MIGSNHFNHSQERLQCDYVTNILQKEMILGVPHLSLTDIIQLIQSEQL